MNIIDIAFLIFGVFAAGLAVALTIELVHIGRERRRDRLAPLPRWYRRLS